MFVDTFIQRPILASVCSLVIILAGAIAIPNLPISQFPDLAPPTVQVNAFYQGASAETVETTVTTPIEQAINGVEGMVYMTSSSGNDGTSNVTITFDINRNIDVAAVDVQNRISQVEGRLPTEVKAVGISVTKASNNFVLAAGVYAENGQYDALFMSNYIDRFIKDEIQRVPGVGNVIIFGERKYAMRLWLDPDRLASRRITADEVVGALREQNVQVAAGQVGQPPARAGQTYQISVRAVGRLSEASEFDNIILKRAADGTLVRLKDVGRTELGAENYATDLRYNGRDAVGFGVLQLPSANQLNVYSSVVAEVDRLSKRFPPGLKAELAFDTTTVVSESISEVVTNASRGDWPRHSRDVPVPPELAHHPDSGHHDPGVPHRHVRVRQAVRLLDQHADAVWHHARDGAGGRRCDRGHREHRAAHPRVPHLAQRGGIDRDERSDERGHRDRAGARGRVRAGRLLPGHDRPALSAVRAHHRVLDGDLGLQRAHAHAGAGGRAARATSRSPRASSSAASTA